MSFPVYLYTMTPLLNIPEIKKRHNDCSLNPLINKKRNGCYHWCLYLLEKIKCRKSGWVPEKSKCQTETGRTKRKFKENHITVIKELKVMQWEWDVVGVYLANIRCGENSS